MDTTDASAGASRQQAAADVPDTDHQVVRLPDGQMHVALNGATDAPVLLMIHGTGASAAWWDRVVPELASTRRVIRVDMLGHGRSTDTTAGYGIALQAARIGAALDELGVQGPVDVVGHSTGGSVATSLIEQRPDLVATLTLINSGPNVEAFISQGPLSKLFTNPLIGRPLWRVSADALVRKALSNAVTRPVDLGPTIVDDAAGMSYEAVTGTGSANVEFLAQRSLPARLAALDVPLMVIFGTEDRRWHSSSAEDYRVVPDVRIEMLPGVGHSPMLEEPDRTISLLQEFAAAGRGARGTRE